MKFSARFEYALMALLFLKCEPDEAPISGRVISEKLNIPYRFLEQILSDLKRQGVVKSVRGQQGGYKLSNDPEGISIYEVFEATEGKLEPWDCSSAETQDGCGRDHNMCAINQFYSDFKTTFTDLLKSYSLNKLCSTAQKLKTANPIDILTK